MIWPSPIKIPLKILHYTFLPNPLLNQKNHIWIDNDESNDEEVQKLLYINHALTFKGEIEDDWLINFMYNFYTTQHPIK